MEMVLQCELLQLHCSNQKRMMSSRYIDIAVIVHKLFLPKQAFLISITPTAELFSAIVCSLVSSFKKYLKWIMNLPHTVCYVCADFLTIVSYKKVPHQQF